MTRLQTLVRRWSCGRGYTLIETLTVMAILSTVLTGLTTLFAAGSKSELEQTRRFEAQLNARLGLDKLRREIHCASAVTPTGPATAVTLTLPAQCSGGGGTITWCALGSASRYGLHRSSAGACDVSDPKYVDYLTSNAVFDYVAQTTSSLAKLKVSLPVDVTPANSVGAYKLEDAIALRNSSRA